MNQGQGHDHPERVKQYHFFVDGNRYDTEQASVSGGDIKRIASVNPDYQLFLEEEGNAPDRQISDSEGIDLTRGAKHFYAVPPATFGA